jgi:hypothetical protein
MGSSKICVDFRKLNRTTKRTLTHLSGMKSLTQLLGMKCIPFSMDFSGDH